MTPPNSHTQLDHLVVIATTLAEGVDWCERTLGITPEAGGEHALFGTHNRLLNISSSEFPRAYLEIIAINPAATPTRAAPLKRWFDMDEVAMREHIASAGPQLIHWVAAVRELSASHADWTHLGIDRGSILKASRPTPDGLLEWQITVRDDGQRLMDGVLPTLIQWGTQHPADSLPTRGVQLEALHLTHSDAPLMEHALRAVGLGTPHITTAVGKLPTVRAKLRTPRGLVTLNG